MGSVVGDIDYLDPAVSKEVNMNREPNAINLGKVVSMRGSVVAIQFDAHLPPICSWRHAKKGKIVIDVLAQLDGHRVRGIALTPN